MMWKLVLGMVLARRSMGKGWSFLMMCDSGSDLCILFIFGEFSTESLRRLFFGVFIVF